VAVGAPFRRPQDPRTIYAGDKITNAVHSSGIPPQGQVIAPADMAY
jgi:hypothetical protein